MTTATMNTTMTMSTMKARMISIKRYSLAAIINIPKLA